MRKLLLGVLLFLFTMPVCSAEEIPDGFKGYKWGTDFILINQEKGLTWENSIDDEGIHISKIDSTPNIEYRYLFYDNKLIGGIINFNDEQSYNKAMGLLTLKFGKANRSQGYAWWSSPNTQISSPFFSMHIEFKSSQYILKTKPQIEQQKKDSAYNNIFN